MASMRCIGPHAVDFEGATLLWPAVSVGNVGQLAADLLINSCGMTRVGLLDTDLVVPAVGNDAYDSDAPGTLHTQLELYGSGKLFVAQQRAPIATGEKRQFVEQLADWIAQCRFERVVLLTSIDAQSRTDRTIQLGDAVFAYVNASWRGAISTAIALDTFPSSRRANDGMPSRSGIARLLCEALARALVPCAVLAVYTVDGDNTFDGYRLASVAQKTFLQGSDASAALKAPRSWSQLSGPPLLDGLY